MAHKLGLSAAGPMVRLERGETTGQDPVFAVACFDSGPGQGGRRRQWVANIWCLAAPLATPMLIAAPVGARPISKAWEGRCQATVRRRAGGGAATSHRLGRAPRRVPALPLPGQLIPQAVAYRPSANSASS